MPAPTTGLEFQSFTIEPTDTATVRWVRCILFAGFVLTVWGWEAEAREVARRALEANNFGEAGAVSLETGQTVHQRLRAMGMDN